MPSKEAPERVGRGILKVWACRRRCFSAAGGQTGAAVVMVAERAAEILLSKDAGPETAKQPELALA